MCVFARPAVGKEPPATWAVVIDVQKHDDNPRLNLRYANNDGDAVQRILVERAGVKREHLLRISDRGKRPPTLRTLRNELPAFLNKIPAGDTVLVFFSGHGALAKGELFLVPRDIKVAQAATTCLPLRELRAALKACKADTKCLILDCCHAAGGPQAGGEPVTGKQLAEELVTDDLKGVAVLAGCTRKQQSFEWDERRHGILTYWLCCALEGGADKDGDGVVTFDEAYSYVEERVAKTAMAVHGKKQTPVRVLSGDVVGVPVLVRLRPESPVTFCRRLAKHLDLEVRAKKLKRVAVMEMIIDRADQRYLATTPLPAMLTAQVRDNLAALAGSDYAVLDETATLAAARGVRVEELDEKPTIQTIRRQGAGLDGIIATKIRRLSGRYEVRAELIMAPDGEVRISTGGRLPQSEDLLAADWPGFTSDRRPEGSPYAPAVLEYILKQVSPTRNQKFPFKITIEGSPTGKGDSWKKKELVLLPRHKSTEKREEVLIGVEKGEFLRVRVKNTLAERVAITLFVDGFNTLGKRRELPSHNAWSYVLGSSADSPDDHVFDGWYVPRRAKMDKTPQGDRRAFTMTPFKVVDLSDSLAARQRFTDAVGVITLVFYGERGRRVAIGEGPEEARTLRVVDFQAGRLIASVNIRYVEKKALQALLGR
jgi:hypothetical protein